MHNAGSPNQIQNQSESTSVKHKSSSPQNSAPNRPTDKKSEFWTQVFGPKGPNGPKTGPGPEGFPWILTFTRCGNISEVLSNQIS